MRTLKDKKNEVVQLLTRYELGEMILGKGFVLLDIQESPWGEGEFLVRGMKQ